MRDNDIAFEMALRMLHIACCPWNHQRLALCGFEVDFLQTAWPRAYACAKKGMKMKFLWHREKGRSGVFCSIGFIVAFSVTRQG